MGRTGRIYRRIRATVVDRPTYFGWVLQGVLAASGMPSSASQLRWLEREGIRSVLSLTESPLPSEWFDGTHLKSKHIPMVDHQPPSPKRLQEAADFIDLEIREGNPVLVHCLAGIGRTGSSIAAYMIAHQGKTADEAIRTLRGLRPRSVEDAQVGAVHEFERYVKGARK